MDLLLTNLSQGDYLRLRRTAAHASLWELSKAVHIDPTKISLFERGVKTPTPEEFQRIESALGRFTAQAP